MLTGITEPLEFSFLFTAPVLFGVQVVLAGSAYMVAHLLNIAVGLTFSGGLIDLILFGVLPGNQKTGWLLLIPAGIVYFLLYYGIFRVLIVKLDLKTPGRESGETQLYTKKDVAEKRAGVSEKKGRQDERKNEEEMCRSAVIVQGLGGKENIEDVDCCATRLRCSIRVPERVQKEVLQSTGASAVIMRGKGVQVIYGPHVTRIKSALEEYLEGEDAPEAERYEKMLEERTRRAETKSGKREQGQKKSATVQRHTVIASPMSGHVLPLEQVSDEVFAEKMIGDGAAVIPEEPYVYAPGDGEITLLYPTGHAIGMKLKDGTELLIHVGIDTVKLDGAGFETLVALGQNVQKGEAILKLDLPYLNAHARSMESPVLCVSMKEGQKVWLPGTGAVKAGEPLYEVWS